MSPVVSRRTFLQNITVGAAAVPLASGALLAQAGRKVRHASFGASGQALSDIRAFSSHGGLRPGGGGRRGPVPRRAA